MGFFRGVLFEGMVCLFLLLLLKTSRNRIKDPVDGMQAAGGGTGTAGPVRLHAEVAQLVYDSILRACELDRAVGES